MKIISVVGARPNFMKIAPFCRAIKTYNSSNPPEEIEHILVHTGQHYDDRMSRSFFESLNIPDADINLGIGSGSHSEQVGNTMIEFEKVLKDHRPDWVVVVGDVNATCACSITCKKEGINLAHIEAGLRSFDMGMPEEINRLVTDRLSDLLFTPDELSSGNLLKEGVGKEKIAFVGNIMIDTLEENRARASNLTIEGILKSNVLDSSQESKISGLTSRFDSLGLVTMHRPSNVDEKSVLVEIVEFLKNDVIEKIPLIWPIHPRTKKNLEKFNIWGKVQGLSNLVFLHPVGYHELLKLNMVSRMVLTDSGGLQEECCVLGTPCLTLRWNTERPITLKEHGGASVLVGNSVERIREAFNHAMLSERQPMRPELWDGNTANRIVDHLVKYGK